MDKKTLKIFVGSVTDISGIGSGKTSTIELMRTGSWDHPSYGHMEITRERLEKFASNFNKGVRKALPIDVEHKWDEGAVGWINKLSIEDLADGGCKLMGEVEWTDEGAELIKMKKYRFFSPEFAEAYTDYASGDEYEDVLIGGGITNRPFFQELDEVVLSNKYLKTKKGGELRKMTKEELKAKLLENPEYTPTEEDQVSEEMLKEVKAEMEGENSDDDGDNTDANKTENAEKTEESQEGGDNKTASQKFNYKKMKDGTVTMSENQLKSLMKSANEGVKAMREVRKMSIDKEIQSFVFSSTNEGGVIQPALQDKVSKFTYTLGDNQRQMFFDILKSLPKIKLFSIIGDEGKRDEDESIVPTGVDANEHKINARAKKLMSEKPEMYKTYSSAAIEAEKQLLSEKAISY